MEKPRVFQYWNSRKLPPFLALCHESVIKHHEKVTLFNESDYHDALRSAGLKIPLTERKQIDANIFRVWLMKTHGGIWLDMDIVCFESFEPVYHDMHTTFASVENHTKLGFDNNVLMAKVGSQEAEGFWGAVENILKKSSMIATPAKVGIPLMKKFIIPSGLIPSWKYAWGDITVDWMKRGEIRIPKGVHAIHLLNSGNHQFLADKTRSWFLGDDTHYIQQVFRKALMAKPLPDAYTFERAF